MLVVSFMTNQYNVPHAVDDFRYSSRALILYKKKLDFDLLALSSFPFMLDKSVSQFLIIHCYISTDPRTDVNSLLSLTTQKMCDKYHFYHTCLQLEILSTERRSNFHQNNTAQIPDRGNDD